MPSGEAPRVVPPLPAPQDSCGGRFSERYRPVDRQRRHFERGDSPNPLGLHSEGRPHCGTPRGLRNPPRPSSTIVRPDVTSGPPVTPREARASSPDVKQSPSLFVEAGAWTPSRRRTASKCSPVEAPSVPTVERAAGYPFFATPSVSEVLRHEPSAAQEGERGVSLTWSGWSGRRAEKARNRSPVVGESIACPAPADAEEHLAREFKEAGVPKRGRLSPHGSPSPMHRSNASLFAPAHEERPGTSPSQTEQPISYALATSVNPMQTTDLRPKGRRASEAPPVNSSAGVSAVFTFTPPEADTSPAPPGSRRSSPGCPPAAPLSSSTPWGTDRCSDGPRPATSTAGFVASRSDASLLQLREGRLAQCSPPIFRNLSHRRISSGSSSTVASVTDHPQRQVSTGKFESKTAKPASGERAGSGRRACGSCASLGR